MGALGNAFRRLMGGGDDGQSGGLVLAARHYAQVNETWARAEALGAGVAARPREEPPPTPQNHEQAAAARPDLANWDLPPGLASVVQAERSDRSARRPGPAPGPGAPPRGATREESLEYGGPAPRRAMDSNEMESLLERLAD